MKPGHAAIISLILALAVGAGAYAAQRTTAAAASHSTAGAAKDVPAAVANRTRALDRMEAALRRALRQRPPALPKIPHYKPVKPVTVAAAAPRATAGGIAQASAPPAPVTPRIVTVRPPPHIVIVHRHGGEHEGGEHAGSAAGGQSGHEHETADD